MKSLFVFSACVAITGAAIAAGVPGNNTAVIIRKAPVESDTGYQFLCVPVRGFDITGQGSVKGVPLNDVLPPSSLPDGATLVVQSNATAEGNVVEGTYTIANNRWTVTGGADPSGTDVGTGKLDNGALIWLAVNGVAETGPFATPSNDVVETPVTTFCGEPVPGATLVPENPQGMVPYGNNTSESVDITATEGIQLVAKPLADDQLLRAREGSNEYQYYNYFSYGPINGWYVLTNNGWEELSQKEVGDHLRTIEPGEAFYYYRATSAN